jgi:hypothetical protein
MAHLKAFLPIPKHIQEYIFLRQKGALLLHRKVFHYKLPYDGADFIALGTGTRSSAVIGKCVSYSIAASPDEVDRMVLEALQYHLGLSYVVQAFDLSWS